MGKVTQIESVLIYDSLNIMMDPAYSFSADFQFYKVVQVFAVLLFGLYVVWLLYYIVRAIGLMREIPQKYSIK